MEARRTPSEFTDDVTPQSVELVKSETGTSLDLTTPSRVSHVPWEVFFTEAVLLKPLSRQVDEELAQEWRAVGATGLVDQISDVAYVQHQDMIRRFIGKDDERAKAVGRDTIIVSSTAFNQLRVRDYPNDLPPLEIRDAIALINKSELFAWVEVKTLQRKRTIDQRLVDLGTVSKHTHEYAVYGVDARGDRYLMARWGLEMPSLESLMTLEAVACANKDLVNLAKVIDADKKEHLIQAYENRVSIMVHDLKYPAITSGSFIAGGILGIVFLSPVFWILLMWGLLMLVVISGLATDDLYQHGRVQTVRAIYGGKNYTDRIMLNTQRKNYVYRGMQKVYIDDRLRKR